MEDQEKKTQEQPQQEPKKLGRLDAWLSDPNREVWVINDMKAVMK